jgi:hypothetical protein
MFMRRSEKNLNENEVCRIIRIETKYWKVTETHIRIDEK